jgi:hypothetical protein
MAPRDEGIKSTGLKNLKNKATVYILHIQACINIIYFPIAWKEAKITIFHKPGKTYDYRKTIAQPPSHKHSELPEQLTGNRLHSHLESLQFFKSTAICLPPTPFRSSSTHDTCNLDCLSN